MNAKEARQLAKTFKGWDDYMYKEEALHRVEKLIEEACEKNQYNLFIEKDDDWMITKCIDDVEIHFEELGYDVTRDYMINREDVMVNIDWFC